MKHFLWFLSISILFVSCEKYDFDRVAFTKVITVGAIEVSATSAFLTGDIEGLRAGKVVESGFVYSDRASGDETLRRGAPNVISQPSPFRDTITVDRAFAARIANLQQGTNYFFRAYIELEDEPDLAYGQIDSFFTPVLDLPSPTILRQEPGCPTTVTVSFQLDGYSPGPGRSTGFVWSKNEEENYPTLQDGVVRQLESSSSNFSGDLEVDCDQTYFVRVFVQNTATEIFYSEVVAFSTRSGGSWIEQPSFPGASVGRKGPIAFAGDQAIYLGAGGEDGRNFSDFYQYTNASKSWQFIDRFDSLEVSHSASASLGSIGFAMGGRPSHNICTECPDEHQQPMVSCICSIDRLMMYDPTGSNWSTLGILPGSGRRMHGAALTIGERLYFGTGIDFHACIDVEVGNCWFTSLNDCAFTINCIAGGSGQAFRFYNLFSDFHYFDESSLTWVAQDDVPGQGRIGAVSMIIDEEGYLGLGRYVEDPKPKIRAFFSESTAMTDLHQFDPTQSPGNQWVRQDDFPEAHQAAIGFGIGSKGFVMATIAEGLSKHFWQFDPNAAGGKQWKALPDFPAAVEGIPQAAVVINTIAFVYFNSNTGSFWMYVPELE